MAQLQSALDQQSGTAPAQITRCFTLACSDPSQVPDVCKLVEMLSQRMPRASLRVVSVDYLLASNGLETGEVDAMLGPRRVAKGFHWTELYRDDAVLIVCRNHHRVSKNISVQIFDSLQHIDTMVTLGDSGHTRRPYLPFPKKNGLNRRVILTVPSFTAAAMGVARTEYAAGIPRRVATVLSKYLPLKIVEFPFPGSTSDVALIWHSRTDADQAARHFREAVIAALRG